MQLRYFKIIRPVSIIVLAFFLWSFGGVFDIAYAFKDSDKLKVKSEKLKTERPEEKFQDTLEKIRDAEERAYKKLEEGEGSETEEKEIKSQKAEIERHDIEIKKQFRETEDKIKGLPEVIKKRHYDFVKKYEENLNTLKSNLNDIEKAKTKEQKQLAHKKTKDFLEKTKPPKKHKPLDPNKLPHRTAEPVWKEPRLKKEQFADELSAEVRKSGSSKVKDFQASQLPGLLVASAGTLDGLLDENSKYSVNAVIPVETGIQTGYPIEAFGYDKLNKGTSNFPTSQLPDLQTGVLYALADPPTDADLAQTIEVQFTPEIRAKAQELGNNPVKIYNWVRNNIEYVPTYGSIQGANYCLQTKQCNDFDTASLLIALLRASGIHARYTYGTIELPVEKVKNWVGGFTNTNAAVELIASGGISVSSVISGGAITSIRLEHVWVEAWIDYLPSRGAKHKTGQGDTWIPLDASFKQYNFTQGIDIKTAVPFDTQTFIDQIKTTSTINETEGYVTNVNSIQIQQAMQDYQTRVQSYIQQNYPNATVGDILGKKEIIKEDFPYLLGTLPYKRIATGAKYSNIPDYLRHKITFRIVKDSYSEIIGDAIKVTKSLPELAGKKITLSYSPATPQDEAVINSFLPQPHPDGTPIQPNELPTSLPAYLISLKPELRIDGIVVATGTPIAMGNTEAFTMIFSGPSASSNDVITNNIEAGEYLGIALDLGRISQEQMLALKTKLDATKSRLQTNDFANMSKDDILGDMLYAAALSYNAKLDVTDFIAARTKGVATIRLPSESIFSFELGIKSVFGIPLYASPGGLAMDVDRSVSIEKALDGNSEKTKAFRLTSGINSSALEHSVPEELFSTPDSPAQGISAVKALQIANNQGIPIYSIKQSNLNTVLPQLQLSADIKNDIVNAVNAGKVVTVSKTNISFNGWTGCGYIIIDPNTGAGAYMISGGMSGGFLCLLAASVFVVLAVLTSETVIGAYAFGMTAFFFSMQGIVLLYGEQAANEFLDCLLKIASFHFLADLAKEALVQAAINPTSALIIEVTITYILLDEGIKLFGECLNELYSSAM